MPFRSNGKDAIPRRPAILSIAAWTSKALTTRIVRTACRRFQCETTPPLGFTLAVWRPWRSKKASWLAMAMSALVEIVVVVVVLRLQNLEEKEEEEDDAGGVVVALGGSPGPGPGGGGPVAAVVRQHLIARLLLPSRSHFNAPKGLEMLVLGLGA